jgi:hypothetical protein
MPENTWRVTKQLVREFWFQTLLSLAWAVYSVGGIPDDSVMWRAFATNFGGALFLLSWFLSQVVRVRRQLRVEDRLEALLAKLSEQTKHLVGYATGGDSYACFSPVLTKSGFGLYIVNMSHYPVFDLWTEYVDVDELATIDPANPAFPDRHSKAVGYIYPNMALGVPNPMTGQPAIYEINMAGRDEMRINLFLHARNGVTTQRLKAVRVEGQLRIAYEVRSRAGGIEQRIPANFPGFNPDDPASVLAGQ